MLIILISAAFVLPEFLAFFTSVTLSEFPQLTSPLTTVIHFYFGADLISVISVQTFFIAELWYSKDTKMEENSEMVE